MCLFCNWKGFLTISKNILYQVGLINNMIDDFILVHCNWMKLISLNSHLTISSRNSPILGTLKLWSDHDEDQLQVASLVMVGSEWQGGNKLDLWELNWSMWKFSLRWIWNVMFKLQPPFVKHLDKSCRILILIYYALIHIENSSGVLQLFPIYLMILAWCYFCGCNLHTGCYYFLFSL